MITVYKLEKDFRYHKYDTWTDGKFSGPLSGLKLKEDEVKRRFNKSYYRTAGDEKESKPKTSKTGKTTEKLEINLKEL